VPLRHLVFDFDGTCTDIPAAHERFLDRYFRLLRAGNPSAGLTPDAWEQALATVRTQSPARGWTLGGAPAAPAAADPYILAYEAAKDLVGADHLDPKLHGSALQGNEAPLRPELAGVLDALDRLGLGLTFVSNSSTAIVAARLDGLLLPRHELLRSRIKVLGDASKFKLEAVPLSPELEELWRELPPVKGPASAPRRGIALGRGHYLRALSEIWCGAALERTGTLVCGDIWELDLALPEALGCEVHLIEREAPYQTCAYERDAVHAAGSRGGSSKDLHGLLARVRRSFEAPQE
jgi:hypothetical protein